MFRHYNEVHYRPRSQDNYVEIKPEMAAILNSNMAAILDSNIANTQNL